MASREANISRIPGSFRDPSGYVFRDDSGAILRSVNPIYEENYRMFMDSGLKNELCQKKYLIDFEETVNPIAENVYKTLKVEPIEFISFPYEWSFSQLKDAALLTLKIQKTALLHNMMLKDASAYNIQFYHGRPIFIDLLSFEKTDEKPWSGYGQFCSHFLAPLALMAKNDISFNAILSRYIDGIPLELASKLLPFSSRFNLGLQLHIHTHARLQRKHQDRRGSARKARKVRISAQQKMLMADNLMSVINSLKCKGCTTEWGDYYNDTNYNDEAFAAKKQLIADFSTRFMPRRVLDIGANTGIFSRLASQNGNMVVAADIDPVAVDKHYSYLKKEHISDVLPLRIDFSNPSPAIGWDNQERESFFARCNFDLVMALALIHHLAISNNIPFPMIAASLAKLGKYLIIEFVPKEDSQVQRLFATREDIFPDYNTDGFINAFSRYFEIIERRPINGSSRELFLLKVK